MYGGGQETAYAMNMNGNSIEASMIPGSTGISPSPTILQQQQQHHNSDLYSNGNAIASLRTHSSKFPIERELILSSDKSGSKVPIKQYPRQIPTTPVAFQRSVANGGGGTPSSSVIQQFLPKSSTAVAPDHPTPKHAWNTQNGNQQEKGQIMGAIPRAPRLPEDVTALAEREMGRDRDSKNAVTKTYHTLKEIISSKFKKDSSELTQEELNNVTIQQHHQTYTNDDVTNSPYYTLMQQHLQLQQQGSWNQQTNGNHQQSQQMWNGSNNRQQPTQQQQHLTRESPVQIAQQVVDMNGQSQQQYSHMIATRASIHQHRATSQPQLNLPFREHQPDDRRGSLANIDVTDSDEGGFATANKMWRMQQQQQNSQQQPRMIPSDTPAHQIMHQQQQNYLKRSSLLQQAQSQQILSNGHYQQQQSNYHITQQSIPDGVYITQKVELNQPPPLPNQQQDWNGMQRINQESVRSSFNQDQPQISQKGEKQIPPIPPAKPSIQPSLHKRAPNYEHPPKIETKKQPIETSTPTSSPTEQNGKQIPGSAASSDYDKSGNQSSNVDSGRGSAAYSSGRKALDTSPDHSDTPVPQTRPKSNDSEWIDIVDAELRNILEPGMQNLNLNRPQSTISGSLSSISPPLPPLSPDGSVQHTNDTNKHTTSSNTVTNKGSSSKQSAPQTTSSSSKKPEYGTDSYNRPGKNKFIGPSRGLPGSLIQKRGEQQMRSSITKKQEQSMMKRHLFGLDDLTSTTTRSLDLDSLLGGPWGGGQSVSDSETDTQGLRHIKSQLEGLETMYGEVLKMLGARPNQVRNLRRRQGSLSSLPSSSVSGRPIRDRRRNDDRKKVRDIKGVNKRFQRLESHVVTLARSVAHLSSEMRSQHLVTQELEQIRQELNYRLQQSGNHFPNKSMDNLNDSQDGPNLTNPKRVKKLTKFFGEDPPLMRLFLKKLGYEKYAALFEAERVGMIELPYLGEEKLQKLGVPLGPRLRILQEAQISLIKDKTLAII